jgi:hypothetical protein
MSIARYFPAEYRQARAAFRSAATAAGARLEAIQHPLRGPQGEQLFTDVAWIGPPDARAALVTVAATHGVEGYCGTGCQVGWMEEGLHKDLPPGVALLAIHAINPHGYAWTRRVTEDNVDLNRNFLDFSKTLPENAGYQALADTVTPREWTDATIAETTRALDAFQKEKGHLAFRMAIYSGQCGDPHGIFFGGHAPTWSNRTLISIFRRYLAKVPRVAVVDYHTGLGPYGHGELIYGMPAGTENFRRLQAWLNNDVTSTELGTSMAQPIQGMNQSAMVEALPHSDVHVIALEYGTWETPEVLLALRADNWLHKHGEIDSPQGRAIKQQIRRALYPDADDWKKLVWERAVQVNRDLLRGLAQSA